MWGTNLKVLAVVLVTLGLFTFLANVIPADAVRRAAGAVVEAAMLHRSSSSPRVSSSSNGAGGCTACHGPGHLGRAPNLLTDEGGTGPMRCALREAQARHVVHMITCTNRACNQPIGAYVVAGYQPIMPDMTKSLSPRADLVRDRVSREQWR